jgi:uncharacterized protein (TIGR00730 family)
MHKDKITPEEINKNIDGHVTEIAREFKQGFEFLKKYQKSVTVFGSARFTDKSSHYTEAKDLAEKISKETGYTILTGGGGGIMEAANKGAFGAKGSSIGLNIILPHEQKLNPNVTDSIHFNYFFARKALMTFSSECYVFFPGGFGTFDELFGILTLIQTGKIPRVPIILFGKDFWIPLKNFIEAHMLNHHRTINKEDMNLFVITDSYDQAIKIIKNASVSDWWTIMD